ncbi:aa3-type cytochrome c oxidase subunit IV [Novosphingobium tardum]|uniref:Aa3-type cytochrome c oxidase subunit IV n=1 Tax=Novosphingobium tardum TaxID=1538021 RepID=A0ABV8RPK7_9SPHN
MKARDCGDRRDSRFNIVHAGKLQMASGNDMKAHGSTYEGFIAMVKWAIPVIAVIVVVVILLIS